MSKIEDVQDKKLIELAENCLEDKRQLDDAKQAHKESTEKLMEMMQDRQQSVLLHRGLRVELSTKQKIKVEKTAAVIGADE
jgi:hypothetical protein